MVEEEGREEVAEVKLPPSRGEFEVKMTTQKKRRILFFFNDEACNRKP